MSRVGAAVALGGLTLAPAFLAPGSSTPSTPVQKNLRTAEPSSSRAGPSFSTSAASVLGAAAVASLVASKKPVRSGAVACQAFDASSQVGVTPPFGFFDPAGFTKGADETEFNRLRACEIKHGRAAMMGALGLLVQSVYKLPGYESVPSGLAAQWTEPGANSLWIVFVAIGMLELGMGPWKEDPSSPGDYGDPLNLAKGNVTDDIRNRELNNGRFAMFAWLGIVSAELYTGSSAVSQFAVAPKAVARTSHGFCGASMATSNSRTLSSRRAFDGASQPGASAPLGFFDPLGLSGTQERFDKFRAAEVKHGRVAMLAIMGSFAAHWATPLGAGAGAAGFSDPIGAKGCVALTFFCGFLELGPWADGYAKSPGDFGDPADFGEKFGSSDDMKTKELNNGRLAMMATIGMCTQEAVFGEKFTDLPAQLGL
ncbi:FCPF [Symbiodinium natans]|uniref:FCPF protein n=1 Tax=Symbiodinium natans TaxID=878477 RepID=A0A812M419_9DINO|nr:FCPF [Symbiodinium natans]